MKISLTEARNLLAPIGAEGRLKWGLEEFGENFALTTSFGIQSAVLLHMISNIEGGSKTPIIWIDTGYLPSETYRYAEELSTRLKINLQIFQSSISAARMEAIYGKLWETGSISDFEKYHELRKVEPLENGFNALSVKCWASGVRGTQTDHRKSMNILDEVRGRFSLRPLLEWSKKETYYYMQTHKLPQHPLFEKGYSTVGDWHSSSADGKTSKGRETRFGGLKEECGIHLPSNKKGDAK